MPPPVAWTQRAGAARPPRRGPQEDEMPNLHMIHTIRVTTIQPGGSCHECGHETRIREGGMMLRFVL